MATFGTLVDDVFNVLAPLWVEISFMVFFMLGFAFFPRTAKGGRSRKSKKADDDKSRLLHKQIEADVEAGHSDAALKAWRSAKALAPTPPETLKTIVQVLVETQADVLVEEVVEHFSAHRSALQNPKNAATVLDVVARAGRVDLLDELAHDFKNKLHIPPSWQTYEMLLGGHAAVGDERKVQDLCAEMNEHDQKLTARSYSLMIKGFLKNGMVDAALAKIQDMQSQGFFVPSFAVAQLFRAACQSDRAQEVFEATMRSPTIPIPNDATTVLMEECFKRNDLAFAVRVEKIAREGSSGFPTAAYDSLLKICVSHADAHTFRVFEHMKQEGNVHISEGLCVGLLARCADSKFLRFAEEVVTFVRSRGGMTIASYSALMKVYAYSGMYDKACDLYAQIRSEGLEPDSLMYGCLMKFSVECGRTELSRELFEKSPSVDIQNYMSLIRAAGRDKDVPRAFAVLEKLKSSGVSVDVAAYNCVLDACVSAGDLKRARALVSEIKTFTSVDIITYNTLLKGFCVKGDLHAAKDLLQEMESAGMTPNDVSYNCLINAAVSNSNFREAWNAIDMMETNGVPVDHYTLSIMMKAMKKSKDPKHLARTMQLVDRSGVDVLSDEVLLNSVLETCTRHRQLPRLTGIISKVTETNFRASLHTYGSLIKACSTIKQLDMCYQLWHRMVDENAMEPNEIVLGCMLDALACNSKTEEAVALLHKWKGKVTPNTVMYSTIIKGFANGQKPSRALDMWKEMEASGLALNIVAYNALIDSQARVGAMNAVSMLVESMEKHGCSPDNITYSTIVKGYCVKGDLDMAFEVFHSMQNNKLAVDSIVYNTIIDGCTRLNRMDLADLALEDMERFEIKPSHFTLGILVKMYGRRHQLDKAFHVVEEMSRKHGLQMNHQVRTCLMGACLSNHDPVRATKVFEEMKVIGGGVDGKAYSSLLCGLVRLGKLEEAVDLVDDAYGLGKVSHRGLPAGQVLEAEALEHLMRGLGQNQRMQAAGVPLLERLRAAKVPISGRLFSASSQNGSRK